VLLSSHPLTRSRVIPNGTTSALPRTWPLRWLIDALREYLGLRAGRRSGPGRWPAAYSGGQVGGQGTDLRDGRRLVRGSEHPADKRGPDDHPVGEGSQPPPPARGPHAQATATGRLVRARTLLTSPAASLPTASLAPVVPINDAA